MPGQETAKDKDTSPPSCPATPLPAEVDYLTHEDLFEDEEQEKEWEHRQSRHFSPK